MIKYLPIVLLVSGCMAAPTFEAGIAPGRIIPSQEFSKAVQQDGAEEFSIYNQTSARTRLVSDGYAHLGGVGETPTGSRAPYVDKVRTGNPSLWPAAGNSSLLASDFRAKQPMDIITILINERSEGSKEADTEADAEFTLQAALTEFFGFETRSLADNFESLDPTSLIDTSTTLEYAGEGETNRSGTLTGTISAVIMEVLPNGLLRVEGTKILAVNNEEEIMVLSGLVRSRDISASNQVDSSRIANMRIDFYGRGIIADQQNPGWGYKLFKMLWPF